MSRHGEDRAGSPPLPTERRFGFFFAGVFAVGATYLGWRHGLRTWALGLGVIAAMFLVVTLLRDAWLRPLNIAWAAFGMLLGRIVSPIVLGAIYFLMLTPIAVVTRRFGRDELRLRRRGAPSYWIERDPVGPAPDSFRNQY